MTIASPSAVDSASAHRHAAPPARAAATGAGRPPQRRPLAVGMGRMTAPQRATVCPLPAEAMMAVLDQMEHGVLVLDASGRVLMRNDAARQELSGGGVLRVEADETLTVREIDSALALKQALTGAVHDGLRQLLRLRTGNARLTVAVQPLRVGAMPPCAMLLMGRRQLCPELTVELLARLHDLTLTERRVLGALLDGRRVAEIARDHKVQVSTLRTQVASLRTKFGVKRIDDLVRMAAELPPMAPAVRSGLASQTDEAQAGDAAGTTDAAGPGRSD